MRTDMYRWLLQVDNGQTQYATPVYRDDLALEYARETNEMFFRAELNGNLTFVGSDYTTIVSAGISSTFHVYLDKRTSQSGAFSNLWHGIFTLTDCTISTDDRTVTVKPRVYDEYTKILEGMEREFNLIDLAPAITPVTVNKRPMLQVYIQGEDILSCFHGGLWWEQDVSAEEDAGKLINDFHFASTQDMRQYTLTHSIPYVTFDPYYGNFPRQTNAQYDVELRNNGLYYLHLSYLMVLGDEITWTFTAEIVRGSDDHVMGTYTETRNNSFDTSTLTFIITSQELSGTVTCVPTSRVIYSRLLCDVETLNGQSTYPIADDDFCYDNRNYRRVLPQQINLANIVMSTNTTATPTPYGRAPNGKYYVRPSASAYPIAKSTWNESSIWYTGTVSETGTKDYVIRTCYRIDAVLSALLSAIDPSITHSATTSYSQFLYASTNPVTGDSQTWLMMTPKSNVLAGENSQPAMKAPITLRSVLNMLRDVYGCYWHVSTNKRLIVEHVKYYKLGGSYDASSPYVSIDLTTLTDERTGKVWGYGVNEYSYDKVNMPERYQYAWMDDVTEQFEGQPIIIQSPFVEKEKIEDVNIGNFTSDIDYMLLAPENISKDGFALMAAYVTGLGDYYLQLTTINGVTLQNAELAMIQLQPKYLLYDMPAWTLTVNEATVQADGIQRKKRQKVTFPLLSFEPYTTPLIRTTLGDGNYNTVTYNLSSFTLNVTIEYDTE